MMWCSVKYKHISSWRGTENFNYFCIDKQSPKTGVQSNPETSYI